jgi:hypothetical protein
MATCATVAEQRPRLSGVLLSKTMKYILILAVPLLLSGCYPFYEADDVNWAVGIRGTHAEAAAFTKGLLGMKSAPQQVEVTPK